ncbi:hypothetical protein HYH02_010549 [Chlamydomonas schloesseri]|uniref:PFU domain-containing protein n=1 Tax=Chlamydomonas schloesseri TaxID=2026947 RepID=A0A835T9R8_9CHLO|nr:hypothetical protein HYH02_010549 [Chlamydomonas schloesseri]|eukprot:KAG2439667.1 hypothetical protein HYH02_010549 [Chlamydomonas schloesseri]
MSADVMRQLAAATGGTYDDLAAKKGAAAPEPGAARVLLVTTVDIGGGASERIEVRQGEAAEDVARAFCSRHGLPDAIVGPLAAHLEENLKKAAGARALQGQGGGDSGKSLDGRASGGLAAPQPAESPKPAPAPAPAPGPAAAGGNGLNATGGSSASASASKPQYSFGAGYDEQLYQQLSNKLMDESQAQSARGRGNNWVSASEVFTGGGGGGVPTTGGGGPPSSGAPSKRSSSGYVGGSKAGADPSPRDSVHLRLYATAQERQARHVERRRMADAEQVAALVAGRSSMSWISAEMMRGRGSGGLYDNYGEMLYKEGVESLMSRLKRAELERKAREDKELEGVTFTPAITKKAWELKQRERSSLSQVMMMGMGMMGGGGGGGGGRSLDGSLLSGAAAAAEEAEKWARLHGRGMRKSTLERLEALRQQKEAREVEECTFRPRINRNSDQLMSERGETLKVLNISHYDQLYADSLRRQAKLQELQSWYPDGVTFQPAVNKDSRAQEYLRRSYERISRQLPAASGNGAGAGSAASPGGPSASSGTAAGSAGNTATTGGGGGGGVPSVVERLYAEYERKQAKLEATRQLLHGPVDPVTRKPLFQPEICRGPRNVAGGRVARPAGTPIGEHLYRAAQEQAAKRAAAEEAERRAAAEEASRSRTTGVSQRMFTELKLKRFRQIFEYLDEEGEAAGAAPGSGLLDLLAALGRAPPYGAPEGAPAAPRSPRADNLDNEVLMDVEAAADVWARANGVLLSPEEQQQQAAAAKASGGGGGISPREGGAAAASPAKSQAGGGSGAGAGAGAGAGGGGLLCGPCPPLSLDMFMSCMEEALRLRRGPRAYLVPSPSAKQAPQHSFRPAINPRSRALAAKSRPDAASTFELLHRVAAQNAERLEALRHEKEEAGLAGCTFQPQLNASSRSASGRALKAAASASGVRGSVNAATGSGNGNGRSGGGGGSFAAAAAGIAAAAGEEEQEAVHARRQDLQQRLSDLRLAAEHAADMQEQLLWEHAAAAAAEQEGGGGGGGAEGGGVGAGEAALDEEVARFALLEAELRDMAALTAVALTDSDKELAALQQQQQQLALAPAPAPAAVQAQAQQQQPGPPRPSAGGGSSLQSLAAELGVGSWQK